LVSASRELRELEIAVLKELHPGEQRVTDIGLYTKVDVDRLYGIEISEFAARIAEVAMWMMDHIMNARLRFWRKFCAHTLKDIAEHS
jgi:hypothetical protein